MISERALEAILAFTAAFHVALDLAAGVALAISIVRPAWRAPQLWLGGLWYGFHAINHLFDTGEAKSEARGWSDTILIAAGALGACRLARVAERPEAR
ncbi:MAG TPA: hypothetical protein VH476_09210 [Solirubrobacterales bacterium]